MFLCRDRVWPNREELCRDKAVLCCNIVSRAGEIFCHDGVSLGRDRVGQIRSFYRNRGFLGRDTVRQGNGKLCRDKASLCRDRVG